MKIELVSFDKPDSLIEGELPVKQGKVDRSALKEIKTLDSKGISDLTDILYNYGYRGTFSVEVESLCYNPRNAILFVDSTGSVFAFIEICFQCNGYSLSSSAVNAGDWCDGKYELLKTFFANKGIAFGTKEDEEDDR